MISENLLLKLKLTANIWKKDSKNLLIKILKN